MYLAEPEKGNGDNDDTTRQNIDTQPAADDALTPVKHMQYDTQQWIKA